MSELVSTALVTGGSRGIGRAIAETLARDGYQVYLTYVSRPDDAANVCKSIEAAGGKAKAFRVDTADQQAIIDLFENEIKGKVQLDVLVNNAGIIKDKMMVHMPDEYFDQVLAVNLRGAFIYMREACKIMREQRKGRIINMSSVSGQRGNLGQTNYAASKAGLVGMTKAAAQEMARRNVTVNCVAPGFISTDMTNSLTDEIKEKTIANIPMRRAGTAQDVAEAVAFLASGKADYITGQEIAVNGGMYM